MSLWDMLAGIGSIGAGISVANDIRGVGQDAATQMGDLATKLKADTAFKGYGVTSGLGTSSVNADGSTNLGVGPDQGFQTSAVNAMLSADAARNNAMADRGLREQEIFNSAMAMQQPMLDQQAGQHRAMEAATGRRGVMGSAFGGTGEDAAMARAQAQAMNQASFQAMNQAETEMMNQANMSNMFNQMANQNYQQSFTPMQMQMQLMGLGGQNADRYQTGQITGANHAAQLGLGGIQAQINAETTAADMYSKLLGAGLSSMTNIGSGMLNQDGKFDILGFLGITE